MLTKEDLQAISSLLAEGNDNTKQEILSHINDLDSSVSSRFENLESQVTVQLKQSDARITEVNEATKNKIFTYIESHVESKINLLAEGQQAIIEAMKTLTPKTKYEELQEEVDFRKEFVKMLSKEVKELKAG